MSKVLQAVRGMNDILPDEAELWESLEEVVRAWLKRHGYRPIRMPVVEPTPLFKRAIGEVTDIVEKEMYSFEDSLNGEALTLRPEGTAGCVRAVLQHNMLYDGPKRLWYSGPMFRHERPQKGRYRQFHQIGVESFGFAGPDIDAEQIVMCARLWEDLGLEGLTLQINSLGTPEERALHRAELVTYLEANGDQLDDDAQRRLHTNPLRVLDSKNPAMQAMIDTAPRLLDYLGEESLAHFQGVQRLLKQAGVSFEINPRLVRGLDYYNLTVFEWVTDKLGAQGTVCAGGRYDGLVSQLGGKPAPACGFAMGVERLIALLVDTMGTLDLPDTDVYVAHQGEQAALMAFDVADRLREQGLDVILHCGGGSFKSQMKKADASGAPFAVIIGDDEATLGEVSLKPLRDERPQQRLAVNDLAERLSELLLADDTEEHEHYDHLH